ncbi:hypothetical protein EV126DRAFT_424410 [Verticillium dahliae]|nr:hypothetical protein EV126DRAFT_436586 [Verticillium dahliae]KAH6699642.1 hypothetical protein EV126DRAFT_424410 [Verticillium dahliae]
MTRGKSNKDFRKGFENRKTGIFKKSDTFYRYYKAKVAVLVIGHDGQLEAYESQHGLIRSLTASPIPQETILGPDNFETVAARHAITPAPSSPPAAAASADLTGSTDAGDAANAADLVVNAVGSPPSSYFTCLSGSSSDGAESYSSLDGELSVSPQAPLATMSASSSSSSGPLSSGSSGKDTDETAPMFNEYDFVNMGDTVFPSMFLEGDMVGTTRRQQTEIFPAMGMSYAKAADTAPHGTESSRRKQALLSLANRCFQV